VASTDQDISMQHLQSIEVVMAFGPVTSESGEKGLLVIEVRWERTPDRCDFQFNLPKSFAENSMNLH